MTVHLDDSYGATKGRLVEAVVHYIEGRWSEDLCTKLASAKNPMGKYKEQISLVQGFTDEAIRRIANACHNVHARLAIHHNACCVVNNLPPEILGYIFRLASGCGDDYRTNLRLALVCSRWRAVSISDPAAWSTFHDKTPANYLTLAMRRNRSTPLSIYMASDTSVTPRRLVQMAKAHLPRMRILQLGFSRDTNGLKTLLSASTPVLSSMKLSYVGKAPDSDLPIIHVPDAPRLATLVLSECIIATQAAPMRFENLLWLEIHVTTSLNLKGLDQCILSLARDSPHLQRLRLQCQSPASFRPPSPASEQVELTNLRAFFLVLPATLAVHLLSSMALPRKLGQINFIINDIHTPLLHQLWSPTCLPAHLFSGFKGASIQFTPPYGIVFDGWRSTGSLDKREFGWGDVHIHSRLVQADLEARDALFPIISHLIASPMPKIVRLELSLSLSKQHKGTRYEEQLASITASFHSLLLHYSSVTSLQIKLDSAHALSSLYSHLRDAAAPLCPSLDCFTLQMSKATTPCDAFLSFIRKLVPRHLRTLRVEDVAFEVKWFSAEERFVREDLPGLAREVWVAGSSMKVERERSARELASRWYWPKGGVSTKR